jgi:hypothetical protein|tara:strand:- start:78 stop:398 length:321 start_codon:yes stop_codon:yes gene_type:complete
VEKRASMDFKVVVWWILFFAIVFLAMSGCNPTPEIPDPKKVPTGKGKIYGELNERKIECRLVKIEPSQDLQGAYSCIYDHPKSDVHDVVTVGQSNMCPNMVFCDKR